MPVALYFFLQKSSQSPLTAPPLEIGFSVPGSFVIRIVFVDYARQWLWELPSLNREGVNPLRGPRLVSLNHSRICEASLRDDLQRGLSGRPRLEPRGQDPQPAGVSRCPASTRTVSSGSRRLICASCRRSFGRRRPHASPRRANANCGWKGLSGLLPLWGVQLKHRLGRLAAWPDGGAVAPADRSGGLHE